MRFLNFFTRRTSGNAATTQQAEGAPPHRNGTVAPPPIIASIIPRAEHHLSRRDISNGALRVLYRLDEAGFDAYLVGGAVRDLLLGGHPKDFDIATNATPEQVRALFRNCRIIGRRFRLAHVMFGSEIVEVATFRGSEDNGNGDRHVIDGRIVRDNVFGTIEEDAIRRDFTVNALYYAIRDFSIHDFVGGLRDLKARQLRLIGDPEQRYREDPVRMLRAVRLAAKLGFDIAPEAAEPLDHLKSLLGESSPARLFDETLKLFLAGHGLASFRELERQGLLAMIFPATARALSGKDAKRFRTLIETTLENTDGRVRDDQSVTPAFLFAAMLWNPLQDRIKTLLEDGREGAIAWTMAVDRTLAEQLQRLAIPRRFTTTVEEIWTMQARFEQRQRKRVFRLLSHPRFRAAYDFLLLRAMADDDLQETAAWWTEAISADPTALSQRLGSRGQHAASDPGDSDAPPSSPPKKRRRRRRRGPAASPESVE